MANMREKMRHIADYYGYGEQSRQLIEEMAELTVAINKKWRGEADGIDNIVEEIADVEIMLEQMKYMLNCDWKVFKTKLVKVDRQIARIKANDRTM